MSANAWKTAPESADSRIGSVIQTLSEQPTLRTAQLAVIIGLAPSSLRELFKRLVGLSIDAYRMEARLQQACKLLTDTSLSVKTIRHKIGIPDGSNFVYHFRHRFGMTPSCFRKRQTVVYTNENGGYTNEMSLRTQRSIVSTAHASHQ